MHFEDGTSGDFDVIVYATGYNITFPFFDPEFLVRARQPHRRCTSGCSSRASTTCVFVGFAQSTPTLFPFVECQARLVAAYAIGRLPLAVGRRRWSTRSRPTSRSSSATSTRPPRHTQQVDYFIYEHDLRTREIPRDAPRGGGTRVSRRRHPGPPTAAEGRPAPQRAARSRSTSTSQESSLESINIADIARRAGVTRSAFYFYFESKAAAVAALMEELYDEIFAVSRELTSREGTPRERASRPWSAGCSTRPATARAPVRRDARGPRDQRGGAEMWDADR